MLLLVRNYLWKKAFKKFEVIWSTEADHNTSYFLTAGCYKLYLFMYKHYFDPYFVFYVEMFQRGIYVVFTGNLYRKLYKSFTELSSFGNM